MKLLILNQLGTPNSPTQLGLIWRNIFVVIGIWHTSVARKKI